MVRFPPEVSLAYILLMGRAASNSPGQKATWPAWQLVGAILGVDAIATIFALFGWFSGPAPHGGFVFLLQNWNHLLI